MVSLRRRSSTKAATPLEAPIVVYRVTVGQLPDRTGSLLDRLFALECLARAGRASSRERAQLLPALRSAEVFIDDEWESDVPHLAVLGQALAAMEALDEHTHEAWVALLETTAEQLANRNSRFGITSDPHLLGSVVRGLAAVGRPLPPALLRACREYLDEKPTSEGSAVLADALVRHQGTSELARHAIETCFSARHVDEPDAAIARWWIAERWQWTLDTPPPVSAEAIDQARTRALISAAPLNGRTAAMLAEVAARSIDDLVVLDRSALERITARRSVKAVQERFVWRAIAFAGVGAALFWQLDAIQARLGFSATGNTLTLISAVIAYIGALGAIHYSAAAYKAGGREIDSVLMTVLQGALPAVIALLLAITQ